VRLKARFGIRLTEADAARLDGLAARQHCSRSEVVRRLLVEAEENPPLSLSDEDELLDLLGARARAGHVEQSNCCYVERRQRLRAWTSTTIRFARSTSLLLVVVRR
jgi:hypothetical protein